MRIRKEAVFFLLFFLAGIFSRALLASKDFTHLDSILYSIGTFDYSLKDGTPPSPGYFIYIMSGRLLNMFTHDPQTSLIFISIFYSGLIAGALYYFGTLLKGHKEGAVSAVLFLTSPLFWYKGITIFGYLNSGFFILLTALFSYLIISGRKGLGFWLSLSFGILLGVRPQELIVMLPLFIYALFHMKPREAAYSLLTLLTACLLWLIPLVLMSGGINEYLTALRKGSAYLAYDSIFGGNFISKFNNHAVRMTQYFIRAYFLGVIPLIYYAGKLFYSPSFADKKKMGFFAVWLAPCLIYNIFMQFGEIGHGMIWGLGLFLILGEAIVVLSGDIAAAIARYARKIPIMATRIYKPVSYILVICPIIAVNSFVFFYDFDKNDKMPFYTFDKYTQANYNYVLKKNRFVIAKTDFIKNKLPSRKSLILTSGVFVHQVMYILPESIVIEANIVNRENRTSFWRCHGRKGTYYRDKRSFMVPDGITKFIVFDDIMIPYIQDKDKVVYYDVDDTYELAGVDVKAGQRIDFDFHSIRIE
jgi:hypothetical protein